jgi:hypothetical protein
MRGQRISPRVGDTVLAVVVIFLALAGIGLMEEYARLDRDYQVLKAGAARCRMAMEVRP